MVTGVGGGGHGMQIVKALRLGRQPYRIIGTDLSPVSFGRTLVDDLAVLPRADDPHYIPALLQLCLDKSVRVLFHGSEPELHAISRSRDHFEKAGIVLPLNPQQVIETCSDKVRLARTLEQLGFRIPRYIHATCLDDLSDFDYFPAVLKPSICGGGSADVYLAQSREELLAAALQLLTMHKEFIVQEYVGTPDSEYTVGVLTNADGAIVNSIAVHRMLGSALSTRLKAPNRTERTELGPILMISSGVSQGYVDRFPEVTGPCERIASALGVRGTVNIQCRYVNGRVVTFEINPRFSGTTSVRALVGYNEPDMIIRERLLGQAPEPRFPYRSGYVLRELSEAFLAGDD
ncbi:MAG TPA: ATP-grasp domain-containing protein [Chloroflexota bacterium]|nr:ATP-grasp domain-containing protein [Chloroflexota bacterium]